MNETITIVAGHRIIGLDIQVIDTIPVRELAQYALEVQYAPPAEDATDEYVEDLIAQAIYGCVCGIVH